MELLAPAVDFPRAGSRAEQGVIGKGIRVRKLGEGRARQGVGLLGSVEDGVSPT